jgi:putative flippase GtrA
VKLDAATMRQFLVFAAVGAVGTAAHYATLIALVQIWRVSPPVATTAGFAVGALVNYVLNYRITFASNARHAHALPKFLTIAAIGAALNYGIVWWLTGRGVHYLLAQVVSTGVVLVLNYAANRAWTFATRGTGTA